MFSNKTRNEILVQDHQHAEIEFLDSTSPHAPVEFVDSQRVAEYCQLVERGQAITQRISAFDA